MPSDDAGKFVRSVLLAAGDEIDGAQKCDEVSLQEPRHGHVHDAKNRDAGELANRSNVLENANDRGLGFVDPRAKARVSAVVVGEFMGKDCTELRDGQEVEQG